LLVVGAVLPELLVGRLVQRAGAHFGEHTVDERGTAGTSLVEGLGVGYVDAARAVAEHAEGTDGRAVELGDERGGRVLHVDVREEVRALLDGRGDEAVVIHVAVADLRPREGDAVVAERGLVGSEEEEREDAGLQALAWVRDRETLPAP